MSKYYDQEKIWKNIKEELSKLDIEDGLFYKIDEDGFTFFEVDDFEFNDPFKIITDLFYYESYDNLRDYELSSIVDISNYIKNHNLYREMIESRCAYNDFLYKNDEPDDEELTKFSNDFEFKAEIYLWTKHIFPAVVITINKLLYERLEVINFAFDAIRGN